MMTLDELALGHHPSIDPEALRELVRWGFAHKGAGVVLLTPEKGHAELRTAYLSHVEICDLLAPAPLLCGRVRAALESYDLDSEFVLLELGLGEQPVLRIISEAVF